MNGNGTYLSGMNHLRTELIYLFKNGTDLFEMSI
jgi:hypothetical protein